MSAPAPSPAPDPRCVHEFNRLGLCRAPAPERVLIDTAESETRRECDKSPKGHPSRHHYVTVRLGTHPGPCSDGLPPYALGPSVGAPPSAPAPPPSPAPEPAPPGLKLWRVTYTFRDFGEILVAAPDWGSAVELARTRADGAGDLPTDGFGDAEFDSTGDGAVYDDAAVDSADRPILEADEKGEPVWVRERTPQDFDEGGH